VLVIRGEPGIGKTALLHHCLRQAAGCRTASITGVESELALPFAALHQLCRPMLSDVSALPEPQANALRVGFQNVAHLADQRRSRPTAAGHDRRRVSAVAVPDLP
jgi:hypothetical protein